MELKHNFYGVNFAPFPRRGVLNSETAHRSMTAMVEGMDQLGWFVSHARAGEETWLKAAYIFLLVGYGTKMGLAPLHNWLPDAHS